MLDTPSENLLTQVEHWLAEFKSATRDEDWDAVERLFLADSHWRERTLRERSFIPAPMMTAATGTAARPW